MATAVFNPATASDLHHAVPRGATLSSPLALGRILFQSAAIIALLLVNRLGLAGNIIFFGALAVMVSRGREWPLKAITLLYLGLICNQWYVPKTPFWTFARFVLPAVVLFQASADLTRLKVSLTSRPYWLFHLLFIGISVVLTVLTGYFVHIALLKLINYTIVTAVIFSEIEIQRARRRDVSEWFVTLITVVVLLGLASFPLGIASNAKAWITDGATSYFNGAFYHSNTMGPFSALMALYLSCVYLFGPYRNRWICGLLIAVLIVFMRLSQSRTSFAALLTGLTFMVLLTIVLSRRRWTVLRMNTARTKLVAGLVAAGIGIVIADIATGGRLSSEATAFINKSGKTSQIDVTDVLYSRLGRIELSWANFCQSPWIGIGFEVSTEPWFQQNATLFNAPVEKGFLPTAILEQSGVIGAAFFVLTIVSLLAYLVKTVNVPGIVMFVAFLAVNFGEVMYFGVAGHGSFGWLMVLAGILLGGNTVRDLRATPLPISMVPPLHES